MADENKNLRIPVTGEESRHVGHKVCPIKVSASGVKAIYCCQDKRLIAFLFNKNKGWDQDVAREAMQTYMKSIEKTEEQHVDQVEGFIKLAIEKAGGDVDIFTPNSPAFEMTDEIADYTTGMDELAANGTALDSVPRETLSKYHVAYLSPDRNLAGGTIVDIDPALDIGAVITKRKEAKSASVMAYIFGQGTAQEAAVWLKTHGIEAGAVDAIIEAEKANCDDIESTKGGPGSGNHGHGGRPGERGGSAPAEGGSPKEGDMFPEVGLLGVKEPHPGNLSDGAIQILDDFVSEPGSWNDGDQSDDEGIVAEIIDGAHQEANRMLEDDENEVVGYMEDRIAYNVLVDVSQGGKGGTVNDTKSVTDNVASKVEAHLKENDYKAGAPKSDVKTTGNVTRAEVRQDWTRGINTITSIKTEETAKTTGSDETTSRYGVKYEVAGGRLKRLERRARGDENFIKIDKAQQIAYGVFLVPNKADHDGDVISPADIQKCAHDFLVEYRAIDEMHKKSAMDAEIVESAIAWQDGLEYYGKTLSKGTWFGAIHVSDKGVWDKIADGTYKGFSVRIAGTREPIEILSEKAGKYVRARIVEPDQFQEDTFRVISVGRDTGIKAIVGKMTGEDVMKIQAYLFSLDKFDEASAAKWLKEHDIKHIKIVVEGAEKGGPGSGNYGHQGRPGERGGSSSEGGSAQGKPGSETKPAKEVGLKVSRFADKVKKLYTSDGDMTPSVEVAEAVRYARMNEKDEAKRQQIYAGIDDNTESLASKGGTEYEAISAENFLGLLKTAGTITEEEHSQMYNIANYGDPFYGKKGIEKGSSSSGNWGHAGRPGERGGSSAGGGKDSSKPEGDQKGPGDAFKEGQKVKFERDGAQVTGHVSDVKGNVLSVTYQQPSGGYKSVDIHATKVTPTGTRITTPDLTTVRVDNLDPLEQQTLNHMKEKNPDMSQAEVLQVIINTTEGDFSQLSDELRTRAENDKTWQKE